MPSMRLPKISLGFVIRRCVTELGHEPTPAEFSKWANTAGEHGGALFGRTINKTEAEVILRHKARPVSARDAKAFTADPSPSATGAPRGSDNVRDRVVDLSAIRAKKRGAKD